jgi:hypothetical protein
LVEERFGEQQQQLRRQCEQANCSGHGDDVGRWLLLLLLLLFSCGK